MLARLEHASDALDHTEVKYLGRLPPAHKYIQVHTHRFYNKNLTKYSLSHMSKSRSHSREYPLTWTWN